ncbi:hypothetical protein GS921_00005 [Rhodococcus hoagii]|nr:hypothetical protein [Prescottella equi]
MDDVAGLVALEVPPHFLAVTPASSDQNVTATSRPQRNSGMARSASTKSIHALSAIVGSHTTRWKLPDSAEHDSPTSTSEGGSAGC